LADTGFLVSRAESAATKHFASRRGMDLDLPGVPAQAIDESNSVGQVALCGSDYPGLKPRLLVKAGDPVRAGQPLFFDKRDPAVMYTAPGSGLITAIYRGPQRKLESIVIRLDKDDQPVVAADHGHDKALELMSREEIVSCLAASGLWPALRRRPFNRVPHSEEQPMAVFVTAMDTEPLAADPSFIIGLEADSFRVGLQVLTRLTRGKLWLCSAPGWNFDNPGIDRVQHAVFEGPHPSGLAGTHIHHIEPVGQHRVVWHISYADVIAIGKLFGKGELDFQRIVAIGGQPVRRPRLLRARIGASLDELLAEELAMDRAVRIISGSVLSGRAPVDGQRFLGRYHLQVSVIPEADQGQRSGGLWRRLADASRKPSTTTMHGSPSGMLPLELFERILPSGFMAVPLLRALMSGDFDQAQALGCLELDEEDLALCTYLCPAKCDYGGALRSILQGMEEEG